MRRVLISVLILLSASSGAWAAYPEWQQGKFPSDGKPVTEYHCAPVTLGPHPAVILLHGAGGYGPQETKFEDLCADLAQRGYYVEAIDYFSQTGGEVGPISDDNFANWSTFVREIESGIDALAKNSAVDSKRIGLVGYSLGAYLALAVGSQQPDKVAAIVEYYGKLLPDYEPLAKNLPPTLILHGSADQIVSVDDAHKLDALLTSANRPHEMHIFPGLPHGFNFVGNTPMCDEHCLRFLDEHLHP